MSLADDLSPERCLEIVISELEKDLKYLKANMPEGAESPQTKLEQYSICAKYLRDAKDCVKEGLKATQIGSDSVATALVLVREEQPLDKYVEIEETGATVETESGQVTLTADQAKELKQKIENVCPPEIIGEPGGMTVTGTPDDRGNFEVTLGPASKEILNEAKDRLADKEGSE